MTSTSRNPDLAVVLIHGLSHSANLKNLVNESYLFDEVLKGDDIAVALAVDDPLKLSPGS